MTWTNAIKSDVIVQEIIMKSTGIFCIRLISFS